jgi:hypothetical protein
MTLSSLWNVDGFPYVNNVNKHTRHSANCNKAARQKWGSYAMNMWKNAPNNIEPLPPASPTILEDDEIPNMPDITLEDDLLGLEDDLANTRGSQPDMIVAPDNVIPLVTVEDVEEEDQEQKSIYYVEAFPINLGAGAVWGEDVPFFENLRREQEETRSSRWGPFEDEDEWELAKWLIRNVGQKQINAFLNLDIVGSHRCEV